MEEKKYNMGQPYYIEMLPFMGCTFLGKTKSYLVYLVSTSTAQNNTWTSSVLIYYFDQG